MSAKKASKTVKGRATKTTRKSKAEVSMPVVLSYEPLDAETFEQYRREGELFSRLLADPATPDSFRDLFGAVFTDALLNRISLKLIGPLVLPAVYPIVRDLLDASNACGTAEGAYEALIAAVETLVPDEVSNAAREVSASK